MLHKSNTGGVLFLNVKPESEVARKAQIIGERMHHLCRILVPPEILSNEEFNKHLTVAVVISIDIANHLGIDSGHARQMAIDNHGATVILMEQQSYSWSLTKNDRRLPKVKNLRTSGSTLMIPLKESMSSLIKGWHRILSVSIKKFLFMRIPP